MSGENIVNDSQSNLTKETLPKEKLDLITHFQEIVGNLDYDESIKIMVEHNWDLEQAVHNIMDIPILPGDSTDSFSPIVYQDQNPTSNYISSSEGVRRRNVGHSTPVEVNNHRIIKYTVNHQSPWYWQILSILWGPFRKLFDVFYYFISAFKPDPRLTIVDPSNDVKTFIETIKSEVSPATLPNFIQRPYGECIADAKESLQYLVVYLHDNNSDSTTLLRDVLCSEKFKRLLHEENVLLWGCSTQLPEGFRVSRLLRQSTFPFLGCIGLQSNHKMALLARIEGAFDCDDLVTQLRSILHSNETPLVLARADKEERTRNQHLRLQQDMDYEESLRQDREKDEVKRSQREKEDRLRAQRLQEEQRVLRLQEDMVRLRAKVASKLPAEASEGEGTLLVRIQLPSEKIARRFYHTDSLKLLYYVVKSQPCAPWNFEILSNFPKRSWPVTPSQPEYDEAEIVRQPRPDCNDPPSFEQFGVTSNITLMVIDNDA